MVAGVGIKEKEWKCCLWWRALVAAKASETCVASAVHDESPLGILVVLAVPFPESFVDYAFISALSLLRKRSSGGRRVASLLVKPSFPRI